MHLAPLIQDLAVILGAATVVAFLFQGIRQPVVLGYLLAGILVGPNTPPFSLVVDLAGIRIWAELGVIFLMFSLGLEMSFKNLLHVGVTAAVAGPFEALFMLALGFAAGKVAGWTSIDSIFLGSILAISSTTIIIKALEELDLKKQPVAQLLFGILIVEDLVGILILVGLSTLAGSQGFSGLAFLWSAVKLLLIVAAWIVVGLLTVPRLINHVARRSNDETLTLLALALCLGLVIFSAYFHYSTALGAFIMGSIIAESNEGQRIETLVGPIRNVFAAIFFVSIGMLFVPHELLRNWRVIIMITTLTIVGKIISGTLGARLGGQNLKTAFAVGCGLAQIGEFSFIIAGLGITLGVMSPLLYSVAVAVAVITTFTTPYLIRVSQPAARRCERKSTRRKAA